MVYLPEFLEPQNCGQCPIWEASDRTPGCGNCDFIQDTTHANEPAANDCWYMLSLLAASDRPFAERGLKFNAIDRYHCVFDVWQHRRYLGRIEKLYDATWLVSRIDNRPHSDQARYVDREEAAQALLKLVFAPAPLRPASVYHDCNWQN